MDESLLILKNVKNLKPSDSVVVGIKMLENMFRVFGYTLLEKPTCTDNLFFELNVIELSDSSIVATYDSMSGDKDFVNIKKYDDEKYLMKTINQTYDKYVGFDSSFDDAIILFNVVDLLKQNGIPYCFEKEYYIAVVWYSYENSDMTLSSPRLLKAKNDKKKTKKTSCGFLFPNGKTKSDIPLDMLNVAYSGKFIEQH